MSWRKHSTHREETRAVKKALIEAGIPVKKVGHGRGTAWAWLEIYLEPSDIGRGWYRGEILEWHRDEVIRIAQEVTGRHGDYNGEINVYCQ